MSPDPATNAGPEEKPIEAGEVGELRDLTEIDICYRLLVAGHLS